MNKYRSMSRACCSKVSIIIEQILDPNTWHYQLPNQDW